MNKLDDTRDPIELMDEVEDVLKIALRRCNPLRGQGVQGFILLGTK